MEGFFGEHGFKNRVSEKDLLEFGSLSEESKGERDVSGVGR